MSRREGRRIRTDIPMNAVSPFLMPTRSGASNAFSATVDIEKCEELIRRLRAEGMKGIGMMHIFMAAYARVTSKCPGINRFIRGQRLYARNDISICMVIKKHLALNAPETVIKLAATPYDTLETIYHQLSKTIEENLREGDQNNMDALVRILVNLPRLILRFFVGILKLLDYFDLLPRFLLDLSPFHASVFITNMGSLGMPPVFHHLYNFGNIPLFIAMGGKRTEYYLDKEGNPQKRRVIDFNITCDDRTCDGHYYATAFKELKRILENPEQLLVPPEKVIEDIK